MSWTASQYLKDFSDEVGGGGNKRIFFFLHCIMLCANIWKICVKSVSQYILNELFEGQED